MKQDMLQMLKCIDKNEAKVIKLVELMVKFTRENLGKQKCGKRRMNLTKVIAGILYYLRTGCTWRALPPVFGNWKTVSAWFVRLASIQIFEKLWIELLQRHNNILSLEHLLCDGSLTITTSNISLKAKNPRMKNKNCVNRVLLTDKNGTPLALTLEKGTANDTNFLIPLLDKTTKLFSLEKNSKVHADKGFDSMKNRIESTKRGAFPIIPVRNHGYAIKYPKQSDKIRPIIEHTFSWINAFKALRIVAIKNTLNLYQAHCFVFIVLLMRLLSLRDIKNMIGSI